MNTQSTSMSPLPKVGLGPKGSTNPGIRVECPSGSQGMVQDGYLRCVNPKGLKPQAPPPPPAKEPGLSRGARVGIAMGGTLALALVTPLNGLGGLVVGATAFVLLTAANHFLAGSGQ